MTHLVIKVRILLEPEDKGTVKAGHWALLITMRKINGKNTPVFLRRATHNKARSKFHCEMSSFLNNSPKDRLSLNGFCMLIVSGIDDGGLVESVRFSGRTLLE